MSEYIVKLKFQGDKAELKKMEKDLNGRFRKIAGGFGKRLTRSIKAGAIALITSAMLVPFDKVNEEFNNLLKRYKDLTTTAEELDVDVGEYEKSRMIAQRHGISNEEFDNMFKSFVSKLDETREGKSNMLTNYKELGNLEAFIKSLSAIREVKPEDQKEFANALYGQGYKGDVRRLAEVDFAKTNQQLYGKQSAEDLTKLIQKVDDLALHNAKLTTEREIDRFNRLAGMAGYRHNSIQNDVMRSRDTKDFNDFANFENVATIAHATQESVNFLQGLSLKVADIYNEITGKKGEKLPPPNKGEGMVDYIQRMNARDKGAFKN